MFITGNANVPTGCIITIGQGGLGGLLDFCRIGKGRRCPQRGQSTVALTGGAGNFQALVGGGNGAIQPPIPDRQPPIECSGGDLNLSQTNEASTVQT